MKKKDGGKYFSGSCCRRTRNNSFKIESIQTRYQKEFFYDDDGETLAQVGHREGRYPVPGNVLV